MVTVLLPGAVRDSSVEHHGVNKKGFAYMFDQDTVALRAQAHGDEKVAR